MENKSLMIINHNTPCSCACKYCFFQSKKTSYGVPYDVGEKIALRFHKWLTSGQLPDLSLSYAISHCADYPELIRNIEFNKKLGFIGFSFLQINGIGLRDADSLKAYLQNVKEAGVTTVDTTFYGLREYHDKFAARKGDFDFLIEIVKNVISLGLTIQPTVVVLEDNKEQLTALFDLLTSLGCTNINGFIQDYRGNGIMLEDVRLTKESYDALPETVRSKTNIPKQKTESEWVTANNFTAPTARNLVLALRPDNIEMLEAMSCEEIIDYLLDIDNRYYSELPDISVLAKQYGDISNTKLYRQRDLWWKWSQAYIRDNKLTLHDITDQRNCGAIRY